MESLTSNETHTSGRLNSGVIAVLRLILSSSILFIIIPLDIDEITDFQVLSAFYAGYSMLLYAIQRIRPWLQDISYWADVVWAAILTTSSGDSSIAFLFLFPTLVASFQWTFFAALQLHLIAASLLISIGFYKAALESELPLPEILLPPIYLLVFGYLVAWWGDREWDSKHRLILLRAITRLSNPRFGIDRMIGTMMERTREFYDAESCLLITVNPARIEYLLRRADRRNPERAMQAVVIPLETAQRLLTPNLDQVTIYPSKPSIWQWWRSTQVDYHVFDVRKGQHSTTPLEVDETLIATLDAESFISLPLYYPDNTSGRIYLTSTQKHAFSPADVGFLLHIIEQIVPVIENIRLVDQLASSAADEERRRLAHDIHDNVIQPYVGFQIGLSALKQKLHAGATDITPEIDRLMVITEQGVNTLRQYIHGLPGTTKRESALLAALQRFAQTFTEATHISVSVEADRDFTINDRLAAEVFQMIVEGLSNIRWHTHATHARINLTRQHNLTHQYGLVDQHDDLVVQIMNDNADQVAPINFMPRSITERATALGGRVYIEHTIENVTQVMIKIPL